MHNKKYNNLSTTILKGDIKGYVDEIVLNRSFISFEIKLPPGIKDSRAIMIDFYISSKMSLAKINEAMQQVYELAHEDANIIFETTVVEDMPREKILYTILYSTECLQAADSNKKLLSWYVR